MKRFRRALTACVLTVAAALPLRAETLTDALIAAYKNSNLLEQNRALLRASDEDVAAAVAKLRPVINYGASLSSRYGENTGWSDLTSSIDLTASITLYDFGRNQISIDLAKETVLATREALVGLEQDVLLSAVRAYMGVISSGQTVSLNENNARVIGQELRAAQDRLELGDGTVTSVALAEARLALARANYAAAQGGLVSAREAYKLVTGSYPGRLQPPPAAPQTASSLEAARNIALRTHPDILQAKRQVTISELSIALAEAAMKPTISGSLSTGFTDLSATGNRHTGSVGLSMSGPIYSGGALSSAVRKAIARRDASRASLLQTVAATEQSVAIAWAQVQTAAARLRAGDEQVRAARVAYNGVREQAELGDVTTLEVLDSEQELLDAESARLTAYSDYYIATYALLESMGLLTVEHLKLGIPTYDPSAYYNAVKDAPGRKVSPQGQKLDRILKGIGKN